MVSGAFGRVGMRCIVAGDVLFSCWTLHALTIKLLKQRNVWSLVLTEKRRTYCGDRQRRLAIDICNGNHQINSAAVTQTATEACVHAWATSARPCGGKAPSCQGWQCSSRIGWMQAPVPAGQTDLRCAGRETACSQRGCSLDGNLAVYCKLQKKMGLGVCGLHCWRSARPL